MLIQILIDTNNTNYNPDKYPYNEELWNIIIPNIKFLGSPGELTPASDIDWDSTKPYFKDSNGHCIYHKSGGYVAAYEYETLWFEEEFLNSVADFTYPNQALSYLLAEIAKKKDIDWGYLKEYNQMQEETDNTPIDWTPILSVWNQHKLINTPLTQMKDKSK